ncbi:uncharacterized protein LOC114343814 [Diabrotica virgifera virgifera]|uniref:Uncharacterized protein n=2 Tax=Diabrotica virgifera virgifera TaxID=50390 RepID=A0ABM5JGZ2_DIAVI|nr:uncharacterized protein LOC114343814 [Diabrotica virgifera virgifera]
MELRFYIILFIVILAWGSTYLMKYMSIDLGTDDIDDCGREGTIEEFLRSTATAKPTPRFCYNYVDDDGYVITLCNENKKEAEKKDTKPYSNNTSNNTSADKIDDDDDDDIEVSDVLNSTMKEKLRRYEEEKIFKAAMKQHYDQIRVYVISWYVVLTFAVIYLVSELTVFIVTVILTVYAVYEAWLEDMFRHY